ncbi:hypothetical protein BT63DRAFT_414760 [Microthyrium microscopicum]|uniref:CBM-cenC domain-containing protein n=1 Tax=Microthyrium microscopicum TaxID=703497 RepID=A0A6A6U9E4_9PEZI|nr:hypothetical protein BT63DRAFT_414760 [Microthyrium microscopicum]
MHAFITLAAILAPALAAPADGLRNKIRANRPPYYPPGFNPYGGTQPTQPTQPTNNTTIPTCPVCPTCQTCPTCPICPPGPIPCNATQSVVNPGFEALGGSFPPWSLSDPSIILLDSTNGGQDPGGLHSAAFVLSTAKNAAYISQNVTVCPNTMYKVYFQVKRNTDATTSTPGSTGFAPSGASAGITQCVIFITLDNAGTYQLQGDATQIPASPMGFNQIITNSTFTTGNTTSAGLMVSAVCSSSAFQVPATVQQGAPPATPIPGTIYFDNIELIPQPPRK